MLLHGHLLYDDEPQPAYPPRPINIITIGILEPPHRPINIITILAIPTSSPMMTLEPFCLFPRRRHLKFAAGGPAHVTAQTRNARSPVATSNPDDPLETPGRSRSHYTIPGTPPAPSSNVSAPPQVAVEKMIHQHHRFNVNKQSITDDRQRRSTTILTGALHVCLSPRRPLSSTGRLITISGTYSVPVQDVITL